MVRKVSILLACVCLLFCVSRSAHAATPEYGAIPTQVLEIARGVLEKHPINSDYVCYTYDDTYFLSVGNFIYNDEMFRFVDQGDSVTYVLKRVDYNQGYMIGFANTPGVVDVSTGQLVYSNLGPYPALIERGTYYEMFTAFIALVILFVVFVLRIFSRR